MSRMGVIPIHAPKHADGGLDEIIDALDIRALAKSLYYGVSWDESADTYVRTGTLASIAAGSSPSSSLIPIQAAMRRCILDDNGVVVYYLDPLDSTKQVGGAASDLTGADGQVMVQIPKFFYRYVYSGTTHTWEISQYPLEGFSVHPAFVKNNEIVDYRYIGSYEGILYDASRAAYTNGLQLTAGSTDFTAVAKTIHRDGESHPFSLLEVGDKLIIAGATDGGNNQTVTIAAGGTGDATITVDEVIVECQNDANVTIETEKDFANDILSSVSGKAAINYGTRANFRALADKRGTGWRQQDFDLISAIQLLYLTEYADWNSQSMIGEGLTEWGGGTWNAWNDYNPIETAGNSNANGNATANVANADGVLGSYMSYRGIENFFGHLWKWVDGINIHNFDDNAGTAYSRAYVCNNDANFADNVSANYQNIADIAETDGYQNTLEQIPRGFLPASVGGGADSSTKITDYLYTHFDNLVAPFDDWRVATLGGAAYGGLLAGVAFWYVNYSSGGQYHYLSGRLAF